MNKIELPLNELPIIPGYVILNKLASGGTAIVYLGIQENLKRKVAIKILNPSFFGEKQFSKRFLKEAQTSAQLIHPNIITIHDVGHSDNSFYIIMEYLGESLKDRLERKGRIEISETLEIIKKIAGALEYANNKGIIHRDIKPGNVMFRYDGTPMLVDFGISRAIDSNTQLTDTGISIGTPRYMSPEQCRGEKVDGRSDIYSLGVMFFELITGKIPFNAENAAGIILKHIQAPIPKLPGVLFKYQPLINGMMAKRKEERFHSGKEIIAIINSKFSNLHSSKEKTLSIQNETTTFLNNELTEISHSHPPVNKINLLSLKKPFLLGISIVIAVGLLFIFINLNTPEKNIQNDIKKGKDYNNKNSNVIFENISKAKEDKTNGEIIKPTKLKSEKVKISKEEQKKIPVKKKEKIKTERQKMVKTLNLLDLPSGIQKEYIKKTKTMTVPNLQEGIKVNGQINLILKINEKGAVTVQHFNDKFLKVIPENKKDTVKKLILEQISKISFIPPKDENSLPVRVENWRLNLKLETSKGNIILFK